ncbi:hypothetical protein EST38_g3633 [Candolleomyces aberdarensis]|uniref:UvrD-like helicase ATP-binding domain-containing protein n=1 Tax=Candolleomyces aberdarensis TaxID=2316362 RepID=A0A4Q2DPE3_9AGAR|nr:hypothetical protein EST38_g3633 [Candolleomyces aberdarensis]
MKPEVRNALPEHWLSELSSKLSRAPSVEAVQAILDELGATSLSNGQVESVLRQLLDATEHKPLLELVLAYGSWSCRLSSWLLKSFPKHSVDEFQTFIHCDILERLSHFLLSLPCTFEREAQLFLSEAKFQVERIPRILKYMADFALDKTETVDEANSGDFVTGRKRKQSHRKHARKMEGQNSSFKQQDLARLNVTDPQTKEDASLNASILLDTLKGTFSQCFDLLQKPEVYGTVQSMFVVLVSTNGGNHRDEKKQQLANCSASEEAPADVTPAAYPCIQPMKAALYFESASGFGDWHILISSRADRDLRGARRSDAKFFEIILKKIVELSNGQFSGDNQKRLTKPDVEFPVFEAKMTRDSRLVYQIDCIPGYENNSERQAIKIFGIYTHAQIDKRFWDSMGYQLSKKGKAYRDRCTFRNQPHDKGDYVIPPATFRLEKEVSDDNIIPELPKEDVDEIHSLLVLEKFVTLSKELLKSGSRHLALNASVDPQEKEIIEHTNSCYVLGRSGTGKTTTVLFKMLGIERAYAQQSEILSVARPRQIFVTQSRVLVTRVEESFSKLWESLEATKKSEEELRELAGQQKLQKEGDSVLYDVDDDVTWKAGLPKKFSLLKDEHFPLFLTFDRLCQLLEGDTENAEGITVNGKRQLVTYNIFLEQYWPHFPQDLTKNLDPALVFNEILGVIKGSEKSLSHVTGYLDLGAYRDLSHRTQHLFANHRHRIYSLFRAYMDRKRKRGEFDSADRTHRILKAFDAAGVPGTKIDYLYVDEAQDNLLIDARLLRLLCRNPNGLFWAGDTAQTIAIGSSFRFDDLKAFLYRLEQRREQGERSATQSELRTFQLAVNYRSHAGIVRCATAVIELITHFWPYAIDSLAPEQGIVDGPNPIFYSGWDTNTVDYIQFLSGNSGELIEFGARQLRDEAAKVELRKQVGDIGLILTLYECKGLEFDDVLLYRFFEDSTVDLSQWRVVLNLVKGATGQSLSAPRFDEERHAGICSELKFLYVAITRSRKNLWIIDCSDKAKPIKTLWESKGYIQSYVPGSDGPRLAQSSTPEEWATTARTLFANRRYLQAMHAFERAGRAREAKISYTHSLRDTARSMQIFDKMAISAKRDAFCSAAESFLECSRGSEGKERRVFLHNAAECFEKAGDCDDSMKDYQRAARAYEDAKEYNIAVRLYEKTEMFDEAVRVTQSHWQEVDKELANHVRQTAKLYYLKNREFGKAKALFDSVEEQLECTYSFRDYARSIQLLGKKAIFAKRNAFFSAAESFLECAQGAEGKERCVLFHNAADCFEEAGNCGDNIKDYRRAARAYEDATEYTPAIRLYSKTGMYDETILVIQNHPQEVDEEFANDVRKKARLYYLENGEFEKAKALLDSVEEPLESREDNIAEGRTMETIDALLDDKEYVESKRWANDLILQGLWESTSLSRKIRYPTDRQLAKDTDAPAPHYTPHLHFFSTGSSFART